jgi:hypothetical protein
MNKPDIFQIDALIRDALKEFIEDLGTCRWRGKEHDCVNRFAHGFLLPRCVPSCFLHHPTQICIEVGVAQPPGIGSGGAARKDLVIWAEPWMSCWNEKWEPVNCPVVVMEWKVALPGKKLRFNRHDRQWLKGFAETNSGAVGTQ